MNRLVKKILSCALCVFSCATCYVGAFTDVAADGKENYTVYGAEATVDTEKSYSGSGESVKLTLKEKTAGISFRTEDLQSYAIGEEVIVDLRLYPDWNGYNGNLKLYKAGDELIDYGFNGKTWNRVRFRTRVFEQDGVKNVSIKLWNGKGMILWLSDFSVTKAPEAQPLFGGVKLYQMEAVGSLMESYVLETADGKIVVIDGGSQEEANALTKFLRTFTNEVDYWFLSHYHSDHSSALLRMLQYQDIKVRNLYYDFPSSAEIKNICGDSDGFVSDALDQAIEDYPEKVENVILPKRGDVVKISDDLTVKVLNNTYTEKNNNYGNNTTIVYKVETPGEDILFLGDLGSVGDMLLEDEWFVSEAKTCTVIQLAHHGQNGTSDRFYEMIEEKKVVLYAAKQWIYDNDGGTGFNTAYLTTLHTRDLVREWGVLDIYTQESGRTLIE